MNAKTAARTANLHMIAAMLEIALVDRPEVSKDFMRHVDFNAPFDARRLADALTPGQLNVLADKIADLTPADNEAMDSRPADSLMIARLTVAIMTQQDREATPF